MVSTRMSAILLAALLLSIASCAGPAQQANQQSPRELRLRVIDPDGHPLSEVHIDRHDPAAWDVVYSSDSVIREGDVHRVLLSPDIDPSFPLSVRSRFGAISVPIPSPDVKEVTVRFPLPGTLDLTVTGIHGDPGHYMIFVAAVRGGATDGYFEGTIHPDDTLAEMAFQPGQYDLEIVRHPLGYDPLIAKRITIKSGVNRLALQLPETYDLTITLPDDATGEFLEAWSATGTPINADREGERQFEYVGLTPGTYSFVLERGEQEEVMTVRVPCPATVDFHPSRIDALHVRVWNLSKEEPLAQAGFEDGDLVIEVQGQSFTSWREARGLLRKAASNAKVEVTVVRQDRQLKLTVPGETIQRQLGTASDMTPTLR